AHQVFCLVDQGLALVFELRNLVVDLLQRTSCLQHVLGIVRRVIDDLLPRRRRHSKRQRRDGQEEPDMAAGHDPTSSGTAAAVGVAAGSIYSTAQSRPWWRSQPVAKPARPLLASRSAMAA